MSVAVIIVAAGRGTRAGDGAPKQWRLLNGQAVLLHTVAAFAGVGRVLVVLHPEDMARGMALLGGTVTLVAGGADRAASVRAALECLEGSDVTRVLIHDGARPLVPAGVIQAVLAALEEGPAAAPALAVTDALLLKPTVSVALSGSIMTAVAPPAYRRMIEYELYRRKGKCYSLRVNDRPPVDGAVRWVRLRNHLNIGS